MGGKNTVLDLFFLHGFKPEGVFDIEKKVPQKLFGGGYITCANFFFSKYGGRESFVQKCRREKVKLKKREKLSVAVDCEFTCLCVTDTVKVRIKGDGFQAEFGGFLLVWLGGHNGGSQNHVTNNIASIISSSLYGGSIGGRTLFLFIKTLENDE